MIKYFCDLCEQEITTDNAARGGFNFNDRLGTTVEVRGREIKVEIIHTIDGTANKGILCRHCILDALYQLDHRQDQGRTRQRSPREPAR